MRFVVFAFIFIGLIYLANLFYGPIIKNHMLEGKMIQLANERRVKADQYLMRDLTAFIQENNIDIRPEQIQIFRQGQNSVIISASYEVHCQFWIMERDYLFEPTSTSQDHGIFPDFSAQY